jgi:hypothetical protein
MTDSEVGRGNHGTVTLRPPTPHNTHPIAVKKVPLPLVRSSPTILLHHHSSQNHLSYLYANTRILSATSAAPTKRKITSSSWRWSTFRVAICTQSRGKNIANLTTTDCMNGPEGQYQLWCTCTRGASFIVMSSFPT